MKSPAPLKPAAIAMTDSVALPSKFKLRLVQKFYSIPFFFALHGNNFTYFEKILWNQSVFDYELLLVREPNISTKVLTWKLYACSYSKNTLSKAVQFELIFGPSREPKETFQRFLIRDG